MESSKDSTEASGGPWGAGKPSRVLVGALLAALAALAAVSVAPVAADSSERDARAAGPAASADTLEAPRVRFPEGWPYPADAEAPASRRGMVVTADSLATAVGLEVLREGGNAVDAAVAVHFALAVVRPRAGNIAGGGFMLLHTAGGEKAALDFRETAPGAATRDMFLDEDGEVTEDSWTGHLASGVPGSVAGMESAHRRYGSLPWERLVEPALRLAREGFEVAPQFHEVLAERAERLARFPATAEAFLPDGEAPSVGSRFRQPDLARSLEAIARDGGEAFYRGWIADSLVAEMDRGGGLIDHADLAEYRAVWREPISFPYRDRTVVSMPPPSSGGVTLAGIFQILEGFDLEAEGWHSADAIHVTVEAMRRAYADRNHWLGDPDFVEMPLERLLSREHAEALRATIDLREASPSRDFPLLPARTSGDPRTHHARESPETTHYTIVDADGTAVAVTTTQNGFFGSAVTVRGAGFLLNNIMDDFTARPGVPNHFGLVQGEANAIRPGARMLSSMSPTLVLAPDGRTELVTGTPGGATIISTVFQVISNQVDHGMTPVAAVHAPRVHHQHLPDLVRYESGGLPPKVVEALKERGHELEERDGVSGNVQSIYLTPDGLRVGISDPRGERGQAAGH